MLSLNKSLQPAAEYVRMSTEHQKYSTENQSQKIQAFAEQHNFSIVETYADKGKSGLSLDGRPALKKLISDVETGNAKFEAVLVYDISRWGRFQDADESAYYEYICKRAGIKVIYCAEQFENDGSPVSTIVKGVKRAMAGEYSRELSTKVFAGQCRLIELGFKQGGTAGYGLRRMLVDQNGDHKGELKIGEHKSLQTDRVILVPGPQDEIDQVHEVYRWFVDDDLSISQIVECLNEKGVSTDKGREWTNSTVRQVLSNEKYIGNSVFNRRSFKLKRKRVENPPEMWVRCDRAFEAIVPPELFFAAQERLSNVRRKFSDISDEEMLTGLRELFLHHGRLTAALIDADPSLPNASCYRRRFGGLRKLYAQMGLLNSEDIDHQAMNERLKGYIASLLSKVEETVVQKGGRAVRSSPPNLLWLNDELTVSINVLKCWESERGPIWKPFGKFTNADISLFARMKSCNEMEQDYLALPSNYLSNQKLQITPKNLDQYRCFLHGSLEFLAAVVSRQSSESLYGKGKDFMR